MAAAMDTPAEDWKKRGRGLELVRGH